MALTTHPADLYSREEIEARAARCHEMIERCIEHGEMFPPDAPWQERGFQRMICTTLGRIKQHREDARKLAVIKEVFGGKQ